MSSAPRSDEPDRWEALFADLSAELDAAAAADLTAEVADRVRRERGQLRLVDRFRAAVDRLVRIQVRGAGTVVGRVAEVGPDFLLVREEFGRRTVLPLVAVLSVTGLGAGTSPPLPANSLDARLDLRHALRRLVRDRAAVSVTLLDGSVLTGTLDQVGADFVELAQHGADEPRRRAAVRSVATVALRAVAAVRSQLPPEG